MLLFLLLALTATHGFIAPLYKVWDKEKKEEKKKESHSPVLFSESPTLRENEPHEMATCQ
jgi:hypothetical protein